MQLFPTSDSLAKLKKGTYIPNVDEVPLINIYNAALQCNKSYTGISQKVNVICDIVSGKVFTGIQTTLSVSGTATGCDIYGHSINVNNSSMINTIGSMYGISASAAAERKVAYLYGGSFGASLGSAYADGANTELYGVWSQAYHGHYANSSKAYGFFSTILGVASGTAVTCGESINFFGFQRNLALAASTVAKGLAIQNWSKQGSGSFGTNYAVYIDDSVRTVASTAAYAIYSLMKSPSLFSGEMRLANITTGVPAVAPAGQASVYAIDNGSGKVKLMVQFPSGAAYQIAIEP